MKKIFLVGGSWVLMLLTACIDMGERVNGSGKVKTETRSVSAAQRIKVAGDMDVFIDLGPTSLKVEADDNVLPYVETTIHENWLEIGTRDNVNINTSKPVKIYITTPEMTDLKVSGSGNVTCNQKFSTSHNTSFAITGSGDITTSINAPKVDAHISGSGNLHIAGETKDVEIHITGSGNYDGPQLKAENATVSIAGSGDAKLFADYNLKASVAGSGNIRYVGNAKVESHIAGSGTVSKDQ